MDAQAEVLTGRNTARAFIGASASETEFVAVAAIGGKGDEIETEQILQRVFELLDFCAELKIESCLGLGIEVARFHLCVEVECLAIDGSELVSGRRTALVVAVAFKLGQV